MALNPLHPYDEDLCVNQTLDGHVGEDVNARLQVGDDAFDIFIPSGGGLNPGLADDAFNTIAQLEAIREMNLEALRHGVSVSETPQPFRYAVDSVQLYNADEEVGVETNEVKTLESYDLEEEGQTIMNDFRTLEGQSAIRDSPEDEEKKRLRRKAARTFLFAGLCAVIGIIAYRYRREIADGFQTVVRWLQSLFGENEVRLIQEGGNDVSSSSETSLDVSSHTVSDVSTITSLDTQSDHAPLMLVSQVPQSIIDAMQPKALPKYEQPLLDYIAAICKFFNINCQSLNDFIALGIQPNGRFADVKEDTVSLAFKAVLETKGDMSVLAELPNPINLTTPVDCAALNRQNISELVERMTDSKMLQLLRIE